MSKKEFEQILRRNQKEAEESIARIRELNRKFNQQVREIRSML